MHDLASYHLSLVVLSNQTGTAPASIIHSRIGTRALITLERRGSGIALHSASSPSMYTPAFRPAGTFYTWRGVIGYCRLYFTDIVIPSAQ